MRWRGRMRILEVSLSSKIFFFSLRWFVAIGVVLSRGVTTGRADVRLPVPVRSPRRVEVSPRYTGGKGGCTDALHA